MLGIHQVITTLNRMEADGVVRRYAIGGAVGATFYLEPVAALDVNVFVALEASPGSVLLEVEPVFRYLCSHGGRVEGEYVHVAGWPVQLLPPTGPLVEEALAEAVALDVQGTAARVFTAEHLVAIASQTGRAKDKAPAPPVPRVRGAGRRPLPGNPEPPRAARRVGPLPAAIPDRYPVTRDLTALLAGKRAYRARLAALPIAEKLRLLDALRERTVALRPAAWLARLSGSELDLPPRRPEVRRT